MSNIGQIYQRFVLKLESDNEINFGFCIRPYLDDKINLDTLIA